MKQRMNRPWVVAMWLCWGVAVVAGLGWLWRYENRPGATGPTPVGWPAGSRLALVPGKCNLVLFVHPHCLCSRATIDELTLLMARCRPGAAARVLFVRPATEPAGWEHTDLWSKASAIPGVTVDVDVGGAEARRFGARTSGQTLLYDASGLLIFRGGLTESRGHMGDNIGLTAVTELIAGRESRHRDTPVFGCALSQ